MEITEGIPLTGPTYVKCRFADAPDAVVVYLGRITNYQSYAAVLTARGVQVVPVELLTPMTEVDVLEQADSSMQIEPPRPKLLDRLRRLLGG